MDRWRETVHYRNQAEMLRDFAERAPRPDHRESLQQVAKYCDALAAALERDLRSTLTPA